MLDAFAENAVYCGRNASGLPGEGVVNRVLLSSFSSSRPADRERGLIGWVSLEVDGLFLLDGLAVRTTRRGALTVTFPERRDARGRRHSIIRPLNDAARLVIERHVLAALGLADEGSAS